MGITATFDEIVNDTTIALENFNVSAGFVARVVDVGASLNAIIVVNLPDGLLVIDSTIE